MAVPKKARKTIRKLKYKEMKDATLLRGIKQGVGMVVKKPFAQIKNRKKATVRGKPVSKKAALCALTNMHLPLPRAVGAYTVAKTTTIVNSNKEVILFGCMKGDRVNHPDPTWYNAVAVDAINAGLPIGGANNARFQYDTALGGSGFNGCRIVPAAVTVQVMCPTPLQSADGILYVGRTKQVLPLMGDTRTWRELAAELVSFSSPRLCSAGKLALRGVKVDAIPNNMSQLSDFVPRGILTGAAEKTWSDGGVNANFEGFAPIFVYNPNNTNVQYLVTVEWRTRFDPSNPAYSGHQFHPVSSDSAWSETIRGLENEGHGVVDMAEGIVDFGDAAMTAVAAAL